jgi:hypothetical protein
MLPLQAFSLSHNSRFILTDSSRISLITGSPGNELYTRFGHSAIRVQDPAKSIDYVFNYGTFDFQTPGFYVKFARGKLLYFLSAYEFYRMQWEYSQLNQSLFEQDLNLTLNQKQEVFNFLLKNYMPENRFYLYDFYFDNCSSRIRDVFKNILADTLVFQYQHITDKKSFRQLTDDHLKQAPWGRFGIDLVLGLPADRVAEPWERMFLPDEMMNCFENARLKSGDREVPFVKSTVTVVAEKNSTNPLLIFTPSATFWGILILILSITILQVFSNKQIISLDIILFSASGLAGFFILFMWIGTAHHVTKNNLNILWTLPLNLLIPFLIIKSSPGKLLKWLLIFNNSICALVLVCWAISPQQFNLAVIPLILLFILRGGYLLLFHYKWPSFLMTITNTYVDRKK